MIPLLYCSVRCKIGLCRVGCLVLAVGLLLVDVSWILQWQNSASACCVLRMGPGLWYSVGRSWFMAGSGFAVHGFSLYLV